MTSNVWLATACAITGAFIGVLGAGGPEPNPEAEAKGSTGLAVQDQGGFGGQIQGTIQGGEGYVPENIESVTYDELVFIDKRYYPDMGSSEHIDPFLSEVFGRLQMDQGNCFKPNFGDSGGYGFYSATKDYYACQAVLRRYSSAGAAFDAHPVHRSGEPKSAVPDVQFTVTKLSSLGDLVQTKLESDLLFNTYVKARTTHVDDGFVRVSAVLAGKEIAAGYFATYSIGAPKFRHWYTTAVELERHVFYISIDGDVTHCGKLPPIEGRMIPSDG